MRSANAPPLTLPPPSSPLSTPRGTLLHEVCASDTLAGLALRYGVQPSAITRLNRLPNAGSLHARTQVRIPKSAGALLAAGAHLAVARQTLPLVRGHTDDDDQYRRDAMLQAPHWVSSMPSLIDPPSVSSRIAARRKGNSDRRRWHEVATGTEMANSVAVSDPGSHESSHESRPG